MKLKEIVKTIENMNKINEMLGNKKHYVYLSLGKYGEYNLKIYTRKDLKELKEIYIEEVVNAILDYDFTQETNIVKSKLKDFDIETCRFVDVENETKVEIFVYEERY